MKLKALSRAGACVASSRLLCDPRSNHRRQPKYDLLLKGGHVIDRKNRISAVRDVAIADGKIAAVAARIDPADAFKVVDVSGLYVTPGTHRHPRPRLRRHRRARAPMPATTASIPTASRSAAA